MVVKIFLIYGCNNNKKVFKIREKTSFFVCEKNKKIFLKKVLTYY